MTTANIGKLIGVALGLCLGVTTLGCEPKPAAAVDATEPAPESNTEYVCPMHPDVTDTKASKCPKCGMKLEPKKK